MRAYTVATTALALGVDQKWLDNLLSHHQVPGVARVQRGVRRRIPPKSIALIAIARTLCAELGVPLHRAIEIAQAMEAHQASDHQISEILVLRLDRGRLVADLNRRLDDAAEVAAVPRRGRPQGPASPSH